jgi:hypothetical protein
MSVRLSAYISAAPTGWIHVKFDIGYFHGNLSRNSRFDENGTAVSGTVRDDRSTFILLTAVRNILHLDNSAKGNHSCFSMAILNGFLLLTTTPRATIEREHFQCNTGYANSLQC